MSLVLTAKKEYVEILSDYLDDVGRDDDHRTGDGTDTGAVGLAVGAG